MSTSTASERVEIAPELLDETAKWARHNLRYDRYVPHSAAPAPSIVLALVERIRSDAERIRELESELEQMEGYLQTELRELD